MGERKRKRDDFFGKHPWCCYCDGSTPAVEVDHWPPRCVLSMRQAPDGYVFPACTSCNRSSSEFEATFRLLALLAPSPNFSEQEIEILLAKAMKDQMRTHPEAVSSLFMTTNQKRAYFRERGLVLPRGQTFSDAHLVNINHPQFTHATFLFGRKLMLSLFYRHMHSPLIRAGGGLLQWMTNASEANEALQKMVAKLPNLELPVHHYTRSLSDQFSYKHFASKEKNLAIFLVTIQSSFVFLGILSNRAEVLEIAGSGWSRFGTLDPAPPAD